MAGHLARELRKHGPTSEFYGGQLWSAQVVASLPPVRGPSQKLYLSESVYPMRELPPFVVGPYYLSSMDCAKYIADNRHLLGDLSAPDDVSVVLWLLALQVHPENVPSFQNLQDMSCSEGLVSLRDLTPHAVRVVHTNLQAGAPFCRGFGSVTWLKPNREYERLDSEREVNAVANAEMSSGGSSDSDGSHTGDDFEAHSAEICQYVNKIQRYKHDCSEIAAQVHSAMVEIMDRSAAEKRVNPAFLVLWRHNLQFALWSPVEVPRTITIVCSPNGIASKVNLGYLFASIYTQNPTQVMDEVTFQRQWQGSKSPDVFVLASGDDGCWESRDDLCQRLVANVIQQYGETSQLIMITGEPWDINGLDESVLLISTVSENLRKKHVYLPWQAWGSRDQSKVR